MDFANSFIADFLAPPSLDSSSCSLPTATEEVFGHNNFFKWPQKFEQKRKTLSGPRYDPEDRRKCIFWQKYVPTKRDDNVTIKMSLHNEKARGGKKFRRRFRVPYALFLKI